MHQATRAGNAEIAKAISPIDICSHRRCAQLSKDCVRIQHPLPDLVERGISRRILRFHPVRLAAHRQNNTAGDSHRRRKHEHSLHLRSFFTARTACAARRLHKIACDNCAHFKVCFFLKKESRLAVAQNPWNLLSQVGAPTRDAHAARFRLPSKNEGQRNTLPNPRASQDPRSKDQLSRTST